ncbi:alpha/beta fold hydrolase [Nocardia caishijiensis]|uniref:Proline iminopeptidase n=1 Tax=Nocardia caishijiensis TaxID=184756 RepID=A0ABQ6YR68_9NOCA|nr:alpha/beta fold hydrolase [Nocardia caishijiensis]KAF0848294.1 proline iminopeptidase [Nocardia caishijiensis]
MSKTVNGITFSTPEEAGVEQLTAEEFASARAMFAEARRQAEDEQVDGPFYPPIEPYDRGMLDVGDAHSIYWEVSGNPEGRPAVVVHDIGAGGGRDFRRMFDPAVYRIIVFDQRGSGASTPHASDPTTSMEAITAPHLIADLERLRNHLQVDRWLIYAEAWACGSALTYAQRYPQRVTELVLVSVALFRREEIDWLFGGLARIMPTQWQMFTDELESHGATEDPLAGYLALLNHDEMSVRGQAAASWCEWLGSVIVRETPDIPWYFREHSADELLATARIGANFFAHGAWLDDDQILRDINRIGGIPLVMVHGERDLTTPAKNAWDLGRALPNSMLYIDTEAGHVPGFEMLSTAAHAIDQFATERPGKA